MIAYTPIDIEFKKIDYAVLLDYVRNHYITNLSYTSKLSPIVVRHEVNDWTDKKEVFDKDIGYELKENYNLYYAPNVEILFPSIIDFIKQLPYKQIIGACFNLHENILPPHRDEIDSTFPTTPERYNVLLTPHYNKESFFICETKDSSRIYPKILEDFPVYAFDNRNFFHGADPVLDARIILVCSGIIDELKHNELITRSVEKFKDYVIRF